MTNRFDHEDAELLVREIDKLIDAKIAAALAEASLTGISAVGAKAKREAAELQASALRAVFMTVLTDPEQLPDDR